MKATGFLAQDRPERTARLDAMRVAERRLLAERKRALEGCDCKEGMFPNAGRRRILFAAGSSLAATAAGFLVPPAAAQHRPTDSTSASEPTGATPPDAPEDPTRVPGRPIEDASYGIRSRFETELRRRSMSPNEFTAWSMTPLEKSLGVVTPSGLHFERFRNGVPAIAPDRHFLHVHGLVERPRRYSMVDLKRFPSISRLHFIECNGNSSSE